MQDAKRHTKCLDNDIFRLAMTAIRYLSLGEQRTRNGFATITADIARAVADG